MNIFELAANISYQAENPDSPKTDVASIDECRAVLHPVEIDKYYSELMTTIYSRTVPGDYLIDVLVNMAVHEQSYVHYSWHANERQKIVLYVGGVNGAGPFAAAAGSPQQAVFFCPWPNEGFEPSVGERLALGFPMPSASLGPCSVEQLAAFSQPIVGTLILRDPPPSTDALVFLEPILQKCDSSTEIIVCGGTPGSSELFDSIVTRLGNSRQQLKLQNLPSANGELSFYLNRPEIQLVPELGWRVASYKETRPIVSSIEETSQDSIYRAAPALEITQPRATFSGGSGIDGTEAVKAYPYYSNQLMEVPAADYYFLHDAFVSERGVVFDKNRSVVMEAMTPYMRPHFRPNDIAEPTVSPNTSRLSGTWIYISSGGAAHTHWLVEGLTRLWIKDLLPQFSGWITPTPQLKYQQDMIAMAFGEKYPYVALNETGGASVSVERLVAWRFCLGQPFPARAMIDRICAAAPVGKNRPERIIVQRSDRPTYRRCLNEASVLEAAVKLGYTVVDPGAMSATEEVATFSAARVIVGAMGAGVHNAIFSQPGAHVIAFTGTGFSEPYLMHFSELRDLSLDILFCDEIHSPDIDPLAGLRSCSFYVDIQKLTAMMAKWC